MEYETPSTGKFTYRAGVFQTTNFNVTLPSEALRKALQPTIDALTVVDQMRRTIESNATPIGKAMADVFRRLDYANEVSKISKASVEKLMHAFDSINLAVKVDQEYVNEYLNPAVVETVIRDIEDGKENYTASLNLESAQIRETMDYIGLDIRAIVDEAVESAIAAHVKTTSAPLQSNSLQKYADMFLEKFLIPLILALILHGFPVQTQTQILQQQVNIFVGQEIQRPTENPPEFQDV